MSRGGDNDRGILLFDSGESKHRTQTDRVLIGEKWIVMCFYSNVSDGKTAECSHLPGLEQ